MFFRTFFPALLCFCLTVSNAQEAPLRFERVEGLSQSTGYSIMKDKQGFLWIATANGLNRYDGMEMKVYKPALEKKRGQMQGRIIRSDLLRDEQEQIWFSTDLTIHCLDKKKEVFRTCDLSDPIAHPSPGGEVPESRLFANPVLLRKGRLWLANSSEGLFELNTETSQYTRHPLTLKDEAGNYLRIMYNGVYDQKDRLWFASNKGLVSFNLGSREWQLYFPGRSFYSLAYCRDTLFVSEGKDLVWLNVNNLRHGKAGFSEEGPGHHRDLIHRVYADQKFNIWTGDEKGNVYCKSFEAAGFRWMGNINGNVNPATNYPVYCFYADTSGILWVGAYVLGLLKAEVNQQGFQSYPRAAVNRTTSDLLVNTIYEDEKNNVWLGSFEKGILVLDKKTGEALPLKLPYTGPKLPYGNSVPLIQCDRKGNLWTSISGYLFVREKGRRAFESIKIPLPSNALQVPQLWSLSEYRQGWLLGTNIGLYYLSKQNNRYTVKHLSWLGQKRVLHTWIHPSGDLWIAFESGGLTIVKDPERPGTLRRLFAETNVKSFAEDEKHQFVWIATSNGLIAYHLPSGKYKNYAEEEGLLNSYTFGIIAGAHELWVSTNYGLSRGSLSVGKNSVFPEIHFTNFTTSEGLPDNQFNAGAFYKGKSGCIYFGTVKGVTWFHPDKIKSKQDFPAIQMIDLLVNGEKADTATAPGYIRELVLPYFKNSLFFRFRGLAYSNPSKIQYAYQLKGWDKNWVHSGTLNEVRYNHLPHGRYVFSVKAANGSGVWNEKAYTVVIIISPPFWRTWWFLGLAALAVLAVAVLLTKWVVQRKLRRQLRESEKQRAIEAERNRISKDMHDEIGSGLTHIALLSELMQTQRKAEEELRKDVGNISTSARRLVQSMSEIIWALNPQNDTLENLLAYLREQTLVYFEPFDMVYSIEFPDEVPPVILSNEQRRNLFLVAKEALNNALKHSGADRISLSMEYQESAIHFWIGDNGKGFDSSKTRIAANGLKNMERRMEDIGGGFAVQTTGTGTVIHFSLQLSGKGKKNPTTFFTSASKH